jgi:transcriptional regulator with XRE-family HTH domain
MDPAKPAHRRRLGETIRAARAAAKLSQEQFAERCDLSARYISNLERGTQEAGIDTLCRIAAGLRVKPHVLLRRSGM